MTSPARLLLENCTAASPLSGERSGAQRIMSSDELDPRTVSAETDSSSLFFANMGLLDRGSAAKLRSFAAALSEALMDDVEALFAETQSVLKDSRVAFRKNRCTS